MNLIAILGIAVALSMDALAVSLANGCMIKELRFHHAFRITFSFGFFQAVMPLLGWLAGISLVNYIKNFDHWIAFGLLMFIGIKMIMQSFQGSGDDQKNSCLHFPTLMLLSFATSIDALAVGVSFAALKIYIIMPVIIIGLVTFLICLTGIYLGNRIGHLISFKLELAGGLILIGIGLKILFEHLS